MTSSDVPTVIVTVLDLVREDNTLLFSLLRFIPTCFAYSFIRV